MIIGRKNHNGILASIPVTMINADRFLHVPVLMCVGRYANQYGSKPPTRM